MTAVTGRRVAAVTGAAGGIGAAVCARLAADGFAVACLDYRADLASEVAAGLSGAARLRPGRARRRVGAGRRWADPC